MRHRALASVAVLAAAGAGSLSAGAQPPRVAWASWTASPRALEAPPSDALERAVLDRCGAPEAGLFDVAGALLAAKLAGGPAPDPDAIAFAQRAAGEPHPWLREWSASARSLDAPAVLEKLDGWLISPASSSRRCGVARGDAPDGSRALLVVQVEALADLAPLPVRARTGQWLTVDARLRVPARGGKVLVMGPSGRPRSLPTSFDGRSLRAPFALEQPGECTVQVMADVAGGPRPVLEAAVFADVEPPTRRVIRTAPGEMDSDGEGGDSDGLARMLAAARASEALPALTRDARLDAVASAHAARVARSHELAHDAGDGNPVARLRDAGIPTDDVGENVAHAPTAALAHRAQWASPSHRANMLRGAPGRFGVGATRDERGEVWAVEVFVGGLPPR